ncbi:MAG TPA: OsmC family protein [bacterium]|nr:OsmC family protein [bacterium]
MDATVRWTSALAFAATAGSGGTIALDATHEHGGGGPSPMEAVLVALGGCTGMDVVSVLEKMRAPLEGLEIRVSGERAEEHPRVFTRIALEYVFTGAGLRAEQVQRAVELSQNRYCSVSAMLRKAAVLTYTWRIAGAA